MYGAGWLGGNAQEPGPWIVPCVGCRATDAATLRATIGKRMAGWQATPPPLPVDSVLWLRNKHCLLWWNWLGMKEPAADLLFPDIRGELGSALCMYVQTQIPVAGFLRPDPRRHHNMTA